MNLTLAVDPDILREARKIAMDLSDGRVYGTVTVRNPFR